VCRLPSFFLPAALYCENTYTIIFLRFTEVAEAKVSSFPYRGKIALEPQPRGNLKLSSPPTPPWSRVRFSINISTIPNINTDSILKIHFTPS
jgi:hypothetical protein